METARKAALAAALAIAAAFGQTPTASPSFAVASIKPSQPGRPFDVVQILEGGSFRGTHVTLLTLIRMAYDLFSYQVKSGPAWIESDTFDILAKPDGVATRDQVKLMLQSLLADRFRLSFHRDTRDVSGYAIVVSRKGPRLQASDPAGRSGKQIGRTFVNGRGISIDSLASSLAQILRCPVADKTGLTGIFDMKLAWTPENSAEPGVSLFTAIEEQLGLKLEAEKVPVELLVIDHLEKPSAN